MILYTFTGVKEGKTKAASGAIRTTDQNRCWPPVTNTSVPVT